MDIKLNENFNELGMTGSTQWYEIKVNLEADNLKDIQQVEYYLDPSVSNPIIVSENPDNNFEIQTTSWKEFPVSAKVIFKDQNKTPLFLQAAQKAY
jgi:transcription initiation factor IIF auxiliary subunit